VKTTVLELSSFSESEELSPSATKGRGREGRVEATKEVFSRRKRRNFLELVKLSIWSFPWMRMVCWGGKSEGISWVWGGKGWGKGEW